MKHYHGGPITPDTCALRAWTGRYAFISYARQDQMKLAAAVCAGFALDNGAFSAWKEALKRGAAMPGWDGFYAFVEQWRRHPRFDFAVVPDVIEGSEEENDQLAAQWPFPRHEGAVVWHTNESTERLVRLANEWPRVCIGSSGEYDVSKPSRLVARLLEVLPDICDADGYPITKLHGLRMLNPAVFEKLPLASADSTNIARNIGIDSAWKGTYQPASKETRTAIMVERIESVNSACRIERSPPAAANDNPNFDLFNEAAA